MPESAKTAAYAEFASTANRWIENHNASSKDFGDLPEILRACLRCCESAHEELKVRLEADPPQKLPLIAQFTDVVWSVAIAAQGLIDAIGDQKLPYYMSANFSQIKICVQSFQDMLRSDAVLAADELRRRVPFGLRPIELDPESQAKMLEMLERDKQHYKLQPTRMPSGDRESLLRKIR